MPNLTEEKLALAESSTLCQQKRAAKRARLIELATKDPSLTIAQLAKVLRMDGRTVRGILNDEGMTLNSMRGSYDR